MTLLTPPSPPRALFPQDIVNEGAERVLSLTAAKRSAFHADVLRHKSRKSLEEMTTPHRGLEHELPPGMILPDPLRAPQAHSTGHTSGPQKSAHGFDSEENITSLQLQLQLKAEEDKRRQEEERRRQEEQRTRQEELRLEQRRIEQEMLRESIVRGIHPNLVPLIFVGLGAGNVAGSGFEMAQQYIAQFQQVGIQVQNTLQTNSGPDVRRDSRVTVTPQYNATQQTPQQGLPPGAATVQGAHTVSQAQQAANVYPSPAYQSPHGQPRTLLAGPSRFPSSTTVPQPPVQSSLPRLTTNEAQVQQAPQGTASSVSGHAQPPPSKGTQMKSQDRTSPSPSIYFHHWQPPGTQNSTPSGKESQKTSPKNNSNTPGSSNPSPRKRKAQGAHQPAPVPSSAPGHISPTVSISNRHNGRRRSSEGVSKTNFDQPGDLDRKRRRSESRERRLETAKSPSSDQPTSSEMQSSKDSESKPST